MRYAKRGARRSGGTGSVALGIAALLAGLSVVAHRQGMALDELSRLDGFRREAALRAAEREELARQVRILESRAQVVPGAAARLGFHVPRDAEMVFLAGAPAEAEEGGA